MVSVKQEFIQVCILKEFFVSQYIYLPSAISDHFLQLGKKKTPVKYSSKRIFVCPYVLSLCQTWLLIFLAAKTKTGSWEFFY